MTPLAQPFVGAWAVPGIGMLLVNDANRSTKAWIAYLDTNPVVIEVLEESGVQWHDADQNQMISSGSGLAAWWS